ncbi:MAG: hypothetical protein A3F47_00175 [Candidatus Staskawiczbacteria bacterium RIFCSPHIGHO2_12_FULL_38_11]|uniref:Uncharacterized protein n=1 Tax=Candidatus Staskawiczbacteria bacterium RIFCSPHIGHO2_12_FULL_38_11 TaxID=1802209 RepID=A0A1G2I7Z9_9BACT|nr:MAG: hypothetical protein A3F47_00175 [Candidatus Staskawiczbacteria bacterium RIFCSPHIGHO2_12_FULL_38_11]
MEEKLPPPKENLSEPQEESHIEAPKNPVEKNPLSKEKDFNDIWNDLMGESELLNEFGYHPVAASEVNREVNGEEVTMVEIPKLNGSPAYVKKEKIQEWIHHLRDEKELAGAKEEIKGAYEEGEKSSENAEAQYEEQDQLTPEELETVKTDFEDLSDSVKSLYEELNQRDQENFSPLIFREHLDDVYHSASTFQSVVESKNIDVDELSAAITLIVSAINQIGQVGMRRDEIKEDSESLQIVSRALRGVFDSTENVIGKLKSIEKEEADYLSNSLKQLSFSAEDKHGWVERKRQSSQDI